PAGEAAGWFSRPFGCVTCHRQVSRLTLKPLGHLSSGFCLSPGEPSCARRAVNQAGGNRVLQPSLGCNEECVLAGMSGWILLAASALSLDSAAAQSTYTYAQPAYAVAPRSAWDNYKIRLAALARQQGVREATIQANVPDLAINQ